MAVERRHRAQQLARLRPHILRLDQVGRTVLTRVTPSPVTTNRVCEQHMMPWHARQGVHQAQCLPLWAVNELCVQAERTAAAFRHEPSMEPRPSTGTAMGRRHMQLQGTPGWHCCTDARHAHTSTHQHGLRRTVCHLRAGPLHRHDVSTARCSKVVGEHSVAAVCGRAVRVHCCHTLFIRVPALPALALRVPGSTNTALYQCFGIAM